MTHGKELVVGSVILASIAVLALGTLWLKGTRFGEVSTPVQVLVREVGQLAEGNQVKLRGVPIGRVATIAVEPGGALVRVRLEIAGDVSIDPADAGVIIAPESLFGDWQAEIVSRSGFPQFDYYELPAGATSVGDTLVLGGYAIPDISRLTAAADEISQNLQRLTDRFDRAFTEETADQLRGAIANVEAMSTEIRNMIAQQATTFADVTADVARASNEISQASTQARMTLQRVDATLARGDVDSILGSVRRTAANVDRISAQVERSTSDLDGTLARADSAFASVQRIAGSVETGQGSLGRLLVDSVFADRAESAMAQLDSLLADVKRNPRRYVRLSIF